MSQIYADKKKPQKEEFRVIQRYAAGGYIETVYTALPIYDTHFPDQRLSAQSADSKSMCANPYLESSILFYVRFSCGGL